MKLELLTMATGGGEKSSKVDKSEGNTVKLFITSYTDDFFAEREFLRHDVSISNYKNNTFVISCMVFDFKYNF